LYVTDSADSVSVPRTGKERVARLRQNPWYRDYERLHDRSARLSRRQAEEVKLGERARDRSTRQAARSGESVRHAKTSSRRLSRQSAEVKRKERARDRTARQAARSNEDDLSSRVTLVEKGCSGMLNTRRTCYSLQTFYFNRPCIRMQFA